MICWVREVVVGGGGGGGGQAREGLMLRHASNVQTSEDRGEKHGNETLHSNNRNSRPAQPNRT